MRYGSKPLEFAKGKNAIVLGSEAEVADVLAKVREAAELGELDALIEKGKAAYLEIYANLQQGKSYFSITTKEGVEKYLSFRQRDVELGHIVKGRHTTIATHLQHFLSFIGKDTKLKELERTDCENYF